LIDGGSSSAFFTNPGSSLVLGFAALLIVVSYTIITINFIVTLVESYLVVSVGFIFLGFGGSRWTAPYTERYLGLAVSIGIKIVLLYCLISAGFNLSVGWLDEAQGIATSTRPAMTAFDVMGGSLIFMMCCWQIPKLFAAVIGGSPALTGGDLIATAAAVGSAALAVGGVAAAGAGAMAGGGAAAGPGPHDCGRERRIGRRGLVWRRRRGFSAFVAVGRLCRGRQRGKQPAGPAIKSGRSQHGCRSRQRLSAPAWVDAVRCGATRHATQDSNRPPGVTGGNHESSQETQRTQSREFRSTQSLPGRAARMG
jgi:type IV secretion system protein TrbL